jgi:hypothetical protein
MNRQTYRRQERENRNERPAGKRYQYRGGCFDYTAEAIEPSYPGFDGLGRPLREMGLAGLVEMGLKKSK